MARQSPPIFPPQSEAEQIDRLLIQLKQRYHGDPQLIRVVRAPLRISPLGAHIDHQFGHVTGMTIDRALRMVFAPTADGTVSIESLNFGPPLSFSLQQVPPQIDQDWGNYIRGAALALQQTYQLETGLVGVISGEMPVGGLSSSAASTLAYLLALETVNDLNVTPEENVSLVRYAENQYIGLNNGILDQTSILFSRPNQLTYIDCKDFGVEQIVTPIQPDSYEIMIVYSGVRRVLAGTSYNNRVAECQEAARLLCEYGGQNPTEGLRLGEVDAAIFASKGHRLPELPQRRATHFFSEYDRVTAGLAAWRAGDLNRFGELVNQSGASSVHNYESGSPQLITLYEILSQTPGVYGSRFSGGGFGGSCIALIDPQARDAVAEAVHDRYPVAHPKEAETYSIHFCQSAGPAQLVDA